MDYNFRALNTYNESKGTKEEEKIEKGKARGVFQGDGVLVFIQAHRRFGEWGKGKQKKKQQEQKMKEDEKKKEEEKKKTQQDLQQKEKQKKDAEKQVENLKK